MNRLSQLLAFHQQDPHDPFILYALALEYENTDLAQALAHYELLLTQHSDYTATYYQAARLYAETGNRSRATEIYEQGLEKLAHTPPSKEYRELQAAYQNFLYDQD